MLFQEFKMNQNAIYFPIKLIFISLNLNNYIICPGEFYFKIHVWLSLLLIRFSNVNVSFLQLSVLLFKSLTVPVPTNIRFEAHNFNTVLRWDYPTMPQTPVFTVQVKNYG